jgi:hypothetical protein
MPSLPLFRMACALAILLAIKPEVVIAPVGFMAQGARSVFGMAGEAAPTIMALCLRDPTSCREAARITGQIRPAGAPPAPHGTP